MIVLRSLVSRLSFWSVLPSIFFAFPISSGAALGQGQQGQWSFSEMMTRLHQEKGKVVGYQLKIEQLPVTGDTKGRITWIQEYQAVSDHLVGAEIHWDKEGEKVIGWQIFGRSDGKAVNGGKDASDASGVVIEMFEVSKEYGGVPMPGPDWRVIGLGFCGDFGFKFEKISKNISEYDRHGGGRIWQTKERLFATFDDQFIEADFKDGFRILKYRNGNEVPDDEKPKLRDFSEWSVRYDRKFELLLPIEATLRCGTSDKTRFQLEWKSVNEPLPMGTAMLKRFADQIPGARYKP